VFSLKGLFGRLGGGGKEPDAPVAATVEYKGYRIRPTPFREGGQFQTAGVIEKTTDAGVKEHRFVRAEKHPTQNDAVEFSVRKAQQIIDQLGDGIFKDG
jgi:hypothetical protein